jgi:hypothetical protein
MSKQSKKKARKRRLRRESMTYYIECSTCGAVDDGSAGAMLTALADALNLLADSGARIKIHHGIVSAESELGGGYVLPLKDGRWTARTVTYDPFPQVTVLRDEADD